jgi:Putative amidoligase enzyme
MHPSLSNLTFGGEFEVLSPLSREAAGRKVTELTGLPVFTAIGRAPADAWKIVHDGSIRGAGQGLEFVSPVLKGDTGIEQVRKVADALKAIGCSVNTSTGFHVHVGAPTSRIDFFKDLVKLYGRFEDSIDQIMPASRRYNSAPYCKSVKLINSAAIDRATTVSGLARAVQESSGAAGSRYHKVNLDSYAKHGTVEFRQHAGTVDADKATNWITICLRLVAAANAGKTGAETGATIARDFSRLDAKARAVAEAIAKPEGATAEEIRAAHGFRALSIKRQAAIAGLQVRVIKSRGKERFFLQATTGNGAVPPTLDGLFEVIDATAEEAAFLRARAVRLASI